MILMLLFRGSFRLVISDMLSSLISSSVCSVSYSDTNVSSLISIGGFRISNMFSSSDPKLSGSD